MKSAVPQARFLVAALVTSVLFAIAGFQLLRSTTASDSESDGLIVTPSRLLFEPLSLGKASVKRVRIANPTPHTRKLIGAFIGCRQKICVTIGGIDMPFELSAGKSVEIEVLARGTSLGAFQETLPVYTDLPNQFEIRIELIGTVE